MYKLLTTTAVILAVATPSFAWTGAAELTQKLESIYTNLDGNTGVPGAGDEFDVLQGTTAGNNGQLSKFFSAVDKGVTYITLEVDPLTNLISTDINEGTTFAAIETAKDDLVNRVNYDLFKNDATLAPTYISTEDYTGTTGTPVKGDGSNTSDNLYTQTDTQGLAGRKINKLLTEVNEANTYLTAADRKDQESQDFIKSWGDGVNGVNGDGDANTFGGADIAEINTHITGFNNAIGEISDVVLDNTDPDNPTIASGSVFGNLGIGGLNADNTNSYLIPAYNDYNSIGAPTVSQGFTSISDWANGYETVVADGSQYYFTGTGVAASDGTTITIDGNAVDLTGTLPEGLTKLN